MMSHAYLEATIDAMRGRGVEFEDGLSEEELQQAELAVGADFPPDLRALLGFALPAGSRFPDWRQPFSLAISERLAWPGDCMCFDISKEQFWMAEWGERPSSLEEAHRVARDHLAKAPLLVPIYSHLYMPVRPCEEGNPVFSVYQTDVVYRGFDLPSYLAAEFDVPNPHTVPVRAREIEFWSELERRTK